MIANKKLAFATALIMVLLISMAVEVLFFNFAIANMIFPHASHIYIRSDGEVDPSSASIRRVGALYTFTDNIADCIIEVQRDDIIIDGAGYTFQGNRYDNGIILTDRSNVTVKNIKFQAFMTAVYLSNASNNIIIANSITDCSFGMYMIGKSKNNTISGNTITMSGDSILCLYSDANEELPANNVFRNNTLENNTYGFWIVWWTERPPSDFINDIDASNTINGKPICYWVNQHNKTVPADAGFVALINCTGITVQDLTITNNRQGMLLVSTTDSLITKNNIANNSEGIFLDYGSHNNAIAENCIANNEYNGVSLTGAHNNNIFNNVITGNQRGIDFSNSYNTTVTNNILTANSEHGIMLGQNSSTTVSRNFIIQGGRGIIISNTSNSTIIENNITNNTDGILVSDSSFNRIIANNITQNRNCGMQLTGTQGNNIIYHNNFINNSWQKGTTVSMPSPSSTNTWDDGKQGNYWSDYTTKYPNATEIDSSGIGNAAYVINENNIDNYPLKAPYGIVPPTQTSPSSPTALIAAATIAVAISMAVLLAYLVKLKKIPQARFNNSVFTLINSAQN